MKRVNFGHKGGFPPEQETLIHLQRDYADDMLEALLGQWGIDPNQIIVGPNGLVLVGDHTELSDLVSNIIGADSRIRIVQVVKKKNVRSVGRGFGHVFQAISGHFADLHLGE